MSINGDKGSNYSFGVDMDVGRPQTSGFNLSYVNSFTAEEGKIYPCFYEYTVAGDRGTLKQESLIRVLNTPVVPLASRQRVFFHSYYEPLGALWAESETFFTKGRTVADSKRLADKSIPLIPLSNKCFKRGGLLDMLGFVNVDPTAEGTTQVPIFKPMMCLKVWIENYINPRIYATWLEYMDSDDSLTNGDRSADDLVDYGFIKDWCFPADAHDFRWNSKVHDNWISSLKDEEDGDDIVQATYDYLFGDLFDRWWTDDYFTTAQLAPIYGDVPYFASTLEGTFQNLGMDAEALPSSGSIVSYAYGNQTYLGFDDVNSFKLASNSGVTADLRTVGANGNVMVGDYTTQGGTQYKEGKFRFINTNNEGTSMAATQKAFVDAMNNTMRVVGSTNMTLDSLRNLACATAILQKLAKTDGSYKEYGLTYFGVRPRLAQDMHAQYIGGSYQPIVFNEVVNTASDQGDISGRGISAGKDHIGHYFADDYGIIMTFMSIMPDTYYSQGWHKQDLYTVSDDFYLPEKAELGMEAILRAEIYRTGSLENDNKVFGYQNRFDYMRYRYNEVHGKVADPESDSYFPYIEQRLFESAPTLTPSFLSTKGNIAGMWRSEKTDGVSYFCQVLNTHMCTRPLPYKAEPNNIGF